MRLTENNIKFTLTSPALKSLKIASVWIWNHSRHWCKVKINNQNIEVLSRPFNGLEGEITGCHLVVQRHHKDIGTQLDLFGEGGDDVHVKSLVYLRKVISLSRRTPTQVYSTFDSPKVLRLLLCA